uniref:Uncharacterized protein n=1 Tax=Anguilla anguilla TaxID=7936 RepID=A0A0E9VFP2_ANGAN
MYSCFLVFRCPKMLSCQRPEELNIL